MKDTSDDSRIGHVQVEGLHHRYATTDEGVADVLVDVSLDVEAGRSLALLGPSGCGKTTLLRSIAGLERPSSGSITIDDRRMSDQKTWVPPERRRVGMVFQDWALFPHLTVSGNVGYGLGRQDRAAHIEASLDLVGLAGLGERMPSTLSGGQQQRVAIARALAPRPTVLLLDEPFSNLDTGLRNELRSEVRSLLLSVGITAVFVTHDQEEAFILGDEVAVMNAGRIVQTASPQKLYTRPASRWIAEFIGDASLITCQASGTAATTPLGTLELETPRTGTIDVLLRPEELALIEGDAATVELVEFYGHDAMVHVTMGDQKLRIRTDPNPPVARGNRVGVAFSGQAVHSFPA